LAAECHKIPSAGAVPVRNNILGIYA